MAKVSEREIWEMERQIKPLRVINVSKIDDGYLIDGAWGMDPIEMHRIMMSLQCSSYIDAMRAVEEGKIKEKKATKAAHKQKFFSIIKKLIGRK